MVALGGLCTMQERLIEAQETRLGVFKPLSDPSLSFDEIKEALNYQRNLLFGLQFSAKGDSLKDFLNDFAFSGKQSLAAAVEEEYGSYNDLLEQAEKTVNEAFPDVSELMQNSNFDLETANEEQENALREEYFARLRDIVEQVPEYFQKGLAIQAANFLTIVNSQEVNFDQQIVNAMKLQINGKINDFVKTSYIGCDEVISTFKEYVESINSIMQDQIDQATDFLVALLNSEDYIVNELNYMMLSVQSGNISEQKDVETIFGRIQDITELLNAETAGQLISQISDDFLGGMTELEGLEEPVSELLNEFNTAVFGMLISLEAENRDSERVLYDLKFWFASRVTTYGNKVREIIKATLEQFPDLSINDKDATELALFQLDLIAYSYSALEEQNKPVEETTEVKEKPIQIFLSDEQILDIAANINGLINLTERQIALVTETKEEFISNLINRENNIDFYVHTYRYITQFIAQESHAVKSLKLWNMDFDTFIDHLYTSSNDEFVQENYFKLKVLNVVIYGNEQSQHFEFLAFSERTQMAAEAFLSNPENAEIKKYVIKAHKLATESAKKLEDVKALVEYFAKGVESKTEYFAGYSFKIQTTVLQTNFNTAQHPSNQINVNFKPEAVNYQFLTFNKPASKTEEPVKKQEIIKEEPQINANVHTPVTQEEKPRTVVIGQFETQKGKGGPSQSNVKEEVKPIVGPANDLGLLDDFSKLQDKTTFDEKVKEELRQLEELKRQNALRENKETGEKGQGSAQNEEELVEDEDLIEPLIRKETDTGVNEPTIESKLPINVNDQIITTSPNKNLKNQKGKGQPGNRSNMDSEDEENEDERQKELKRRQQEIRDRPVISNKSLLAQLSPETFQNIRKQRRGGQFFDEKTFNLPSEIQRQGSDINEDEIEGLLNQSHTSELRDNEESSELDPEDLKKALQKLKDELKGQKDAPIGKNPAGGQTLAQDLQFEEPVFFSPSISRKQSIEESPLHNSLIGDEEGLLSNEIKPQISSPKNHIVNDKQNYVRVITGPTEDPIYEDLRNMEILDVVRKYQTAPNEEGVITEFIFIQVVPANSACADQVRRLQQQNQGQRVY